MSGTNLSGALCASRCALNNLKLVGILSIDDFYHELGLLYHRSILGLGAPSASWPVSKARSVRFRSALV
jgi:hypothetical protein